MVLIKEQIKYFLVGFIIIILSTPLGYASVNFLGSLYGNLAGEYVPLLNGFIYSYMLIGVLVFSLGIVNMLASKFKD